MRIKKINVKNFKSYKGFSTFDFESDEDRNIILIGGENGAGKSSIFEAIKLCLYGYASYSYKGIVPNYIARIKSMINEDVYVEDEIEAFIELEFELREAGKLENYSMKRIWTFDQGKFSEELKIKKNARTLNKEEIEEFEEFFKSIISPNVFDLFFFDGEKLLDFFQEGSMSRKIRDTILTLNNFDIFSILSRELELNSRKKAREKDQLREEVIKAEVLEDELRKLKEGHGETLEEIELRLKEIEGLQEEIQASNESFLRAGGLEQGERDGLILKIARLEELRSQKNQELKDFSNDHLPFIILRNQLKKLAHQIEVEEDFIAYKTIEKRLDKKELEKIFKGRIQGDLDLLVEELKNLISPLEDGQDFKAIHKLSKGQSNKVLSQISRNLELDPSDISFPEDFRLIREEVKDARDRLSSSMDQDEEKFYLEEIKRLNLELNKSIGELERLKSKRDELELRLLRKEQEVKRAVEKIDSIKKANNIKDISKELRDTTEILLDSLTAKKKLEVEGYFNEIFRKIIRKEKFIDYIDIDDKFNISLYVYKHYSKRDLIQMIMNLGMQEIEKKFGSAFVEELYSRAGKRDRRDLLIYLNSLSKDHELILSTRVDVKNLSSGEKQVYVLCLYWALIKSSNIDIPFIIDTPYARIDEVHRKGITIDYLPNISNQVIVLSTNTEIEEELYKDIKEFVAKEYTLIYDVDNRGSKVIDGYFNEVI